MKPSNKLPPRQWREPSRSRVTHPVWIVLGILVEMVLGFICVALIVGIAIFIAMVLAGCQFVTEGYADPAGTSGDTGGPETVAFRPRCDIDVPCSFPEDDSGANGSGGSAAEDSESSGAIEAGESSSSDASDDTSTGETGDDTGLYGPCDADCRFNMPDFPMGCTCTVMCMTDADCPGDGVCPNELHWCVMLECNEGQILETSYEPGVPAFCVWP